MSTTTPSTSTTALATTTTTSVQDRIGSLRATFASTALRATYRFGAESDQIEVTISQDPTAEPHLEAILVPAAGSKLIRTGDQTVFCDTEAAACFEIPGTSQTAASGLLGPVSGVLLASGRSAPIIDVVTGETVEIAGRTGLCFEIDVPVQAGLATDKALQCIDSEFGFVLSLESIDGDTTETILVLMEFGDPRPDDFAPVAPVEANP